MTERITSPADTGPTVPAIRTRRGTVSPGAAGNRTAQERFQREAAARRAVFAGSLAGLVVVFGLIATAGKPASADSVPEPAVVHSPASPDRVVAEVPIGNIAGSGEPETVIRIVAPQPRAVAPHVRTRATR